MKSAKDLFATVRKQLGEFFSKMGKGKAIRLGILAALFLVVLIVGLSFLSSTKYTVLYSEMKASDAGEIMKVLSSMGVDAKAQGTDTILVPSDKADSLRMELAAQGYPESGVNYDIFEKASGLGTTDMEKQTYLQFQLQDNLRRTILMLDGVKDAAVSISLASDSPYVLSGEDKPANAAIMLETEDGDKLTQSQVKAIGELVSKSVPGGIEMENIRIIDSKMTLYDLTGEEESQTTGTQLELQNQARDSLQQQVINLLTPVFGSGNVLAEVNVVLDFDKKTTESVEFAPPVEGETEGIAVSGADLAETIRNYNGAEGTTGVDSNGGSDSYTAQDEDGNDVYSKVTKEVNMEVNQTKTKIESAQGQIKELSVAVILNSALEIEDYTTNVKDLVAKAVGVDPANVSVERLPFQEDTQSEAAQALAQQQKIMSEKQTAEIIKVGVIALAVLLVVFIVLRFLRNTFRKPAAVAGGEVYVVGDTGARSEGGIKEELSPTQLSKQEIADYIESNAESVAMLLRNWLTDDD